VFIVLLNSDTDFSSA